MVLQVIRISLIAGLGIAVLAGCAGGQILASGAQHDKDASLITSAADSPIWMRPSFGYGRDTIELDTGQSVWVTEGDFLIEDCYAVLDGRTPQEHLHVIPGRHYFVGCDKNSRATFADVGPAPQE